MIQATILDLGPFRGNSPAGVVWKTSACSFVKSVSKWMFLYKWPLYDLFWPFFSHMYVYLSQNWGSDGPFEVPNGSKS